MNAPDSTPIWAIALVFFCSMLGAVGQAFFKAGAGALSLKPAELARNWQVGVGLAAYGVATLLFLFALKHGRLSMLYPVIAMSYVWVFLISWLCFREFEGKSVLPNLGGVLLIFAGVVLVALGR